MSPDPDYKEHWDEKFRSGSWGRYPPEDLVRFFGRNYKAIEDKSGISVLELGCGPGANLWFLHREGYTVSGIDGSPAAIEQAAQRLAHENAHINTAKPDLVVGDISSLPWEDNSFDVVIDIFAIYANTLDVIKQAVAETRRVLKPGGLFYSKLWGKNTTGCGSGQEVEQGTYDEITEGPCKNMGISHFFDADEIGTLFSDFDTKAIETILRTDSIGNIRIEEYHCQFRRPD